MAIPSYQTLMLPLLKKISDGQPHRMREVVNSLSNKFGLTEEERRETLSYSRQPIIENRIEWASTYLHKAGLLTVPKRGYIKITNKGLKVLKQKPAKIDMEFLEQFPEFIEFKTLFK